VSTSAQFPPAEIVRLYINPASAAKRRSIPILVNDEAGSPECAGWQPLSNSEHLGECAPSLKKVIDLTEKRLRDALRVTRPWTMCKWIEKGAVR
jgi:hypothetical protein